MHTFPHTECPGIVQAFAGLAGLSVSPGLHPAGPGAVRGAEGCTHLEQLARSLGPVVVQAVTSRRALAVSRGEAEDLLAGAGSPWARDSCHVWAEGGIADQKLAAGWRPGSRALSGPAAGGLRPSRGTDPVTAGPARSGTASPTRPPAGHWSAVAVGGRASLRRLHAVGDGGVHAVRHRHHRCSSTGPPTRSRSGTISGLGPVLVDGQGITLYLFDHRSPGLAVPVLRHLRHPVAAAHPPGRGGRRRWPDPGSSPGCSARPRGPTGPPRSPTTGGRSTCGHRTGPRAQATGQALTNAGGLWYVVDPAGNAVVTSDDPSRAGATGRPDEATGTWPESDRDPCGRSTRPAPSCRSTRRVRSSRSARSVRSCSVGSIGSALSLASVGSFLSVASPALASPRWSRSVLRSVRPPLMGSRSAAARPAQLVGPPSQPRLRNR